MHSAAVSFDLPNGTTIVGDRWTGQRVPVVLAHGGGQTRHSWGQTAVALADAGHSVLVIDQRGHGDSSWDPQGRYQFTDYADDGVELLNELNEPVVWVGASLGGMAGMQVAQSRPELIAALVLVDITAHPAAAGVERVLTFMAETSRTGFDSLEAAADAVAAYQPGRTRPRNLNGLKKNLRLGDDDRWRWHWDPAFMDTRHDAEEDRERFRVRLEAAARSLTCPTMLIRGKNSDLVTEAEVREFQKMVPHARYTDVANAAHMVAGDVNDVFTAAVLEFLASLD